MTQAACSIASRSSFWMCSRVDGSLKSETNCSRRAAEKPSDGEAPYAYGQ